MDSEKILSRPTYTIRTLWSFGMEKLRCECMGKVTGQSQESNTSLRMAAQYGARFLNRIGIPIRDEESGEGLLALNPIKFWRQRIGFVSEMRLSCGETIRA